MRMVPRGDTCPSCGLVQLVKEYHSLGCHLSRDIRIATLEKENKYLEECVGHAVDGAWPTLLELRAELDRYREALGQLEGPCLYSRRMRDGLPCDCDPCIATRALKGEKDAEV